MRSRHDHSNICAVFEYVWANFFLQATADRSLGGWPHPQNRISPPTFTPIIDGMRVDRNLVTNFIHALLRVDDNELGLNGRLWMFSLTCAATFMMHYPDFKKKVGSNHFVVVHAEAVFTKFGLNSATVREWCNKIRSYWDRENASCLIRGDESAVAAALQSQLNFFAEELSKLKEQGRKIESQLQTLSQQQRQLIDMFADFFKYQGIHSPPRSTPQAEQSSGEVAISINASLFTTTTSGEEATVVPAIQVEERAAKPAFELKRYDNSSQYSLTTLKDFTVSRAISD